MGQQIQYRSSIGRQDCGPPVNLCGVPTIPDELKGKDSFTDEEKAAISIAIAHARLELRRRKEKALREQRVVQVHMRTDCTIRTCGTAYRRNGETVIGTY